MQSLIPSEDVQQRGHLMAEQARFSFYIIPFKDEPLRKSVERLAGLGYSAFEIPGEPSLYQTTEVKQLLEQTGIKVSAVCGRLTGATRDLTTVDESHRSNAIDYFKSLVDMAASLQA